MKKLHLYPLSDVCVQYDINPPIGFQDMLQIQKCGEKDARGDAKTAR